MPCPSLAELEKEALQVQRTVDELFTCAHKKRVLCLSKSSLKVQPRDSPGSSLKVPCSWEPLSPGGGGLVGHSHVRTFPNIWE